MVAIGNTLYSSDDVATQAPAPSSEVATGGTLGDDGEGLGDAEGDAEAIDLTSLEGEVPKVTRMRIICSSGTAGCYVHITGFGFHAKCTCWTEAQSVWERRQITGKEDLICFADAEQKW